MSKPSSSTSAKLIRGLLLRRLQYNLHLPQPNRPFSSCTSTIPNLPSYSAICNFSSSSSSETKTSLISQFQHSKPKPSFSNTFTFTFKPPHNPNFSFTSTGFRFFSSVNNATSPKRSSTSQPQLFLPL